MEALQSLWDAVHWESASVAAVVSASLTAIGYLFKSRRDNKQFRTKIAEDARLAENARQHDIKKLKFERRQLEHRQAVELAEAFEVTARSISRGIARLALNRMIIRDVENPGSQPVHSDPKINERALNKVRKTFSTMNLPGVKAYASDRANDLQKSIHDLRHQADVLNAKSDTLGKAANRTHLELDRLLSPDLDSQALMNAGTASHAVVESFHQVVGEYRMLPLEKLDESISEAGPPDNQRRP